MPVRYVVGVALLSFAIGLCVLLGSLGWFAVGFGMMTDCTNSYGCTSSGCPPCATTQRWITAGGVAQWALAGIGTVVLVRGVRASSASRLLAGGAVVLLASTLTIVGTTWRAGDSYCRPGSPGYASSYCSTST